jgi:hypothetical protein
LFLRHGLRVLLACYAQIPFRAVDLIVVFIFRFHFLNQQALSLDSCPAASREIFDHVGLLTDPYGLLFSGRCSSEQHLHDGGDLGFDLLEVYSCVHNPLADEGLDRSEIDLDATLPKLIGMGAGVVGELLAGG